MPRRMLLNMRLKSLRNIKSVNVSNFSAVVDKKAKITEYRVNVNVSFEVE